MSRIAALAACYGSRGADLRIAGQKPCAGFLAFEKPARCKPTDAIQQPFM